MYHAYLAGSEWDYVILSTVRSLPRSEIETKPTTGWMRRNLGFITDENQINVALTRARRGLIIIGEWQRYKLVAMLHRWRTLYDFRNNND
jgi:superfamily I DNA and/or RNA helicase